MLGAKAKSRLITQCSSASPTLSSRPQRKLYTLAAEQLGTVGGGNHYVDLYRDDDGWLWVAVHFGSRGFGHRTTMGFIALSQGRSFDDHVPEGSMDAPPIFFDARSELGQDYLAAIELAGEYAYAGRDIVVEKVLEILGARATYTVHNHHNFLWREEHFGPAVVGSAERLHTGFSRTSVIHRFDDGRYRGHRRGH